MRGVFTLIEGIIVIMKHIFVSLVLLFTICEGVDGQTIVELVQGTKELTPTAYYDLSREAEQFYQQQNFAKAAETYEKLTKPYPLDGEKWQRLALSLYQLQKFREAAQAFIKASETGVSGLPPNSANYLPQYNALYVAMSYASAGDNVNALAWLEKTLWDFRYNNSRQSLMNIPAFASLRNNPRFVELAGGLPKKEFTRDEGWRYDVDYLLAEIKRLNPVYSKQPLPTELVQNAERLKKEIPNLSNEQILVELQHLLVLLKQSHNNLFNPGNLVKLTQLPVYFYVFPEGLYIVDAVAPYEDLIGARVLRFDETPAERAIEANAFLTSRENEMAILWTAPENLKILQYLHALKITKAANRAELTVIDREGKTRAVSPEPISLLPREKLKVPRLAKKNAPAPLFLSRPDDFYWFEYLPKDKTLYLQFNQVANKQNGESLADFGLRLRDFLAKNDVGNLIVDVRRNNGGSTVNYRELLRTLIDFGADKNKKLFLITGRWTFSAASNFTAEVDRLTNTVVVGEPGSSTPLMMGGDEAFITLPYSGVGGALACTSWMLTGPRDSRMWVVPDIPVQLTAKDYFANLDTVMETLLTILRGEAKQ